ncbi:unnamed protein product [Ambrosiozyma monospora]|uniref:Unnamed protein product n=1 Tax=Ambrosiozyma monospora TaxID=43982 RepID=A0ACB5UD83_AMBMO|nr:unnamed protein product [Ambrosiozyma monospora]
MISCYRREYRNGKMELIINLKQLNFDAVKCINVFVKDWSFGVVVLLDDVSKDTNRFQLSEFTTAKYVKLEVPCVTSNMRNCGMTKRYKSKLKQAPKG